MAILEYLIRLHINTVHNHEIIKSQILSFIQLFILHNIFIAGPTTRRAWTDFYGNKSDDENSQTNGEYQLM